MTLARQPLQPLPPHVVMDKLGGPLGKVVACVSQLTQTACGFNSAEYLGDYGERMRRVFAAALRPGGMREWLRDHAPDGEMLQDRVVAATSMTLLQSYASPQRDEVRIIMELLSDMYFTDDENARAYMLMAEGLEDLIDQGPAAPPTRIGETVEHVHVFLLEAKAVMWRLIGESKFPRLSESDPHLSRSDMVARTTEMLELMERKRSALRRVAGMISQVCDGLGAGHGSLPVLAELARKTRATMLLYIVGICSMRLRLLDMSSHGLEHVDMAVDALQEVQADAEAFAFLTPTERFKVCIYSVALYTARARRRNKELVRKIDPPGLVKRAFASLIAVSLELGLLPNSEGDMPMPPGSFGVDDALIDEQKIMLYGYIMEASFFFDLNGLPDGVSMKSVIHTYRQTMARAQHAVMNEGAAFVLPDVWRALAQTVDVSQIVCERSIKCLPCAYATASAANLIIKECGKRFDLAYWLGQECTPFMHRLDALAQAAPEDELPQQPTPQAMIEGAV